MITRITALFLLVCAGSLSAQAADSVKALEMSRGQALVQADTVALSRMLATEFVERRRISMRELMSVRRLPRMLENLRRAIWAATAERRSRNETINERVEV